MQPLVSKYEMICTELHELNKDITQLQNKKAQLERTRDEIAAKLKESIGNNIPERHIRTENGGIVRINAQGIKVLEVE